MHETMCEMHRTNEQFVKMMEVLTDRVQEMQAIILATSSRRISRESINKLKNQQVSKNRINSLPTTKLQPF